MVWKKKRVKEIVYEGIRYALKRDWDYDCTMCDLRMKCAFSGEGNHIKGLCSSLIEDYYCFSKIEEGNPNGH